MEKALPKPQTYLKRTSNVPQTHPANTSNVPQTHHNWIHLEKPRSLKRTWNVLRKHPANASSAPQRLEVESLFTERLGKAERHFITGSSKMQFHAKVNACAENLCCMQTNASMARCISSANNVLQSQRQQTDPHLAQMMERANVQKNLFCKFEPATVITKTVLREEKSDKHESPAPFSANNCSPNLPVIPRANLASTDLANEYTWKRSKERSQFIVNPQRPGHWLSL